MKSLIKIRTNVGFKYQGGKANPILVFLNKEADRNFLHLSVHMFTHNEWSKGLSNQAWIVSHKYYHQNVGLAGYNCSKIS